MGDSDQMISKMLVCSCKKMCGGGRHLKYLNITYVPINLKLEHPPPPAIPQAFDYFPCPGSKEFDVTGLPGDGAFDLCLGRMGDLNRKCQV